MWSSLWLLVLKDDRMAPHDGGWPCSHGASELCGALAGKLEHVQACEMEAPCPVIRAMRGWVA
jgi:hypothetical protein